MTSSRTFMSTFQTLRKSVSSSLILVAVALFPLQGFAQGGTFSCNSSFGLTLGDGSPIFVGETVTLTVEVSAGDIASGTYLEIDQFKFGGDCENLQGILDDPPFGICTSPGNDISFDDTTLATTCIDGANAPVTLAVTDAAAGDLADLTPNNPVRLYDPADVGQTGGQSSCTISGDFTVNSLIDPEMDDRIHQAFGWTFESGLCDNDEGSSSNNTFSFKVSLPDIDIEKATNGEDADQPTGPLIVVSDPVTWTYEVTNTGNETLTDIAVTDSDIGAITCPQTSLDAGAAMTCTANGTAIEGQYANDSDVIGTFETVDVTDEDPSHYLGVTPEIEIVKEISIDGGQTWYDADTPDAAPQATAPSDAEYRFTITNTGGVNLTNILVSDDTIAYAWPATVPDLAPGENFVIDSGDISELIVTDRCTAAGTFENVASVTAVMADDSTVTVSDDNPAWLLCDARLTTFHVTKIFSDANPMDIEVYLYCNTGQPLEQHFTINHGVENGVRFVVTLFDDEQLDCRAFEDPLPEGYSTRYDLLDSMSDGYVDDTGCYWEDVTPGDQNECRIFNDLEPVTVYAEKIWLGEDPGYGGYPDVVFALSCSETGHQGNRTINGSGVVSWTFLPSWREDICDIREIEPIDDSILTEFNDYCFDRVIGPGFDYAGNPSSGTPPVDWCVYTNTQFFEGVPTLNQYGMLLLIILTMGLGAVGIRRFV